MDTANHGLEREVALCSSPPFQTSVRKDRGIRRRAVGELVERLGHGLGVFWGDEPACAFGVDDLGDAPGPGGEHGPCTGHGIDQSRSQAFGT